MPRKKFIPFPDVTFETEKLFPLQNFEFPSVFDILSKSDEEIVGHYQSHNLVHSHCPNKVCSRYNSKLVLEFGNANSRGYLKCSICKETYSSRPAVFENLNGDHKFLYAHLYAFSLELNLSQTQNFLGTGKVNGHKARDFRKRMQCVIIKALEVENVQLGGGVSNPVAVDEMQKGRRRVGNGAQKGHATRVHGDAFGACDNDRYRFNMQSKEHPGAPRFEQIENDFQSWLRPDSLVYSDGAKAYIKFQDTYPELVKYLVQLNHSVGQWRKRVVIEGKKTNATTNKIDGAWSHLRRFFSSHMVNQNDSFRYIKEFEFFFGSWAKSQNSFERLLHYMQVGYDPDMITGPDLADPWADISKSNILCSMLLFYSKMPHRFTPF